VKSYDIGEGKWASPVQPAASSGSGSLVCVGRLDRSLVFVYDAGGQYYGGLICKSLPLLPYIGVTTTAAADGFGIQIDLDGVGSGSPAAKAGLRERDIIYAADDAAVNTQQDLQYALSQHAPGDSLVLSVSRAGQNLDITVKLGGQL
jgi:predicted metalloprotease with PDZ domain